MTYPADAEYRLHMALLEVERTAIPVANGDVAAVRKLQDALAALRELRLELGAENEIELARCVFCGGSAHPAECGTIV